MEEMGKILHCQVSPLLPHLQHEIKSFTFNTGTNKILNRGSEIFALHSSRRNGSEIFALHSSRRNGSEIFALHLDHCLPLLSIKTARNNLHGVCLASSICSTHEVSLIWIEVDNLLAIDGEELALNDLIILSGC